MSQIDLNCRPALAAHVRLQIDPVSGEPILLFSEGLLVLNPTAQEIVLHCNGKTTVSEIVTALGDEYEVDEATIQDDVIECLTDLLARNLVVVKS
jgi:pyrroloquinoline quinone biosynthesis protein D